MHYKYAYKNKGTCNFKSDVGSCYCKIRFSQLCSLTENKKVMEILFFSNITNNPNN